MVSVKSRWTRVLLGVGLDWLRLFAELIRDRRFMDSDHPIKFKRLFVIAAESLSSITCNSPCLDGC